MHVCTGTRYCYDCAAEFNLGELCDDVHCGSYGRCDAGLCVCDEGHSGSSCEIGPCSNIDCSNHGRCSEGICSCDTGYDGYNCQARCWGS